MNSAVKRIGAVGANLVRTEGAPARSVVSVEDELAGYRWMLAAAQDNLSESIVHSDAALDTVTTGYSTTPRHKSRRSHVEQRLTDTRTFVLEARAAADAAVEAQQRIGIVHERLGAAATRPGWPSDDVRVAVSEINQKAQTGLADFHSTTQRLADIATLAPAGELRRAVRAHRFFGRGYDDFSENVRRRAKEAITTQVRISGHGPEPMRAAFENKYTVKYPGDDPVMAAAWKTLDVVAGPVDSVRVNGRVPYVHFADLNVEDTGAALRLQALSERARALRSDLAELDDKLVRSYSREARHPAISPTELEAIGSNRGARNQQVEEEARRLFGTGS